MCSTARSPLSKTMGVVGLFKMCRAQEPLPVDFMNIGRMEFVHGML